MGDMNKRQRKKYRKQAEHPERPQAQLALRRVMVAEPEAREVVRSVIARQLQRLLDVVEASHPHVMSGRIVFGREPSSPIHYILDGHTPIPCPDLAQYEAWLATADRHVVDTTLPSGTRISTVFLPMAYGI